jgi:hypothetical protein
MSKKTELFSAKLDVKGTVYYEGLYSSCSGQASMLSACDHGNKPFGSIKDGEFIDQLNSSYQVLWFTKLVKLVSY